MNRRKARPAPPPPPPEPLCALDGYSLRRLAAEMRDEAGRCRFRTRSMGHRRGVDALHAAADKLDEAAEILSRTVDECGVNP